LSIYLLLFPLRFSLSQFLLSAKKVIGKEMAMNLFLVLSGSYHGRSNTFEEQALCSVSRLKNNALNFEAEY
jgi:hypothetical protein